MSDEDRDALFRLDGKRALVVGGYGGIGRLVSELFSEHGAAVAVAGRSREKAEQAAAEIGGDAIGLSTDVGDRASAIAAVDAVRERLGGIDILVNLAAVELTGPAEEVTEEQWEATLDINLGGAFWLSQAAGKAMIEQGQGGRIVHYSSTRSLAGGRRGFSAYGASKSGVNLLVKQLATEWGQHSITVNAIAPGFVPTPLMAEAAADNKFMQMMRMRIPFGRFAEPIEMASVTLFLASPAASFVTGQILCVDGGVMASS
jgi:NAD(P)-dependent dehydrogenase (short-subunit alcohol dehydrogenase family)